MSSNEPNDPIVLSTELEKNEKSSKENFSNSFLNNSNVNLKNFQNAATASLQSSSQNGSPAEINGLAVGNTEVEYIETENLTDLISVDATLNVFYFFLSLKCRSKFFCKVHVFSLVVLAIVYVVISFMKTLLARLDSKDWVSVCEALNNVRQLSLYHKEKLIDFLEDLIQKIVKSLKNPRSAVCKTAIMTCGDMFQIFNDSMIGFLDPLLVQLLLKSSQDKRFVCEASETALIAMTTWISPFLLLPKLQPYLKNKNPRIRAKASMCFSRSVPKLGNEGIKGYGINKLMEIAASQLSDQLPESREAARTLAGELYSFYERSKVSTNEDSSQNVENLSWEAFCHAELSALSAQAILRVTSATKEGPTMDC